MSPAARCLGCLALLTAGCIITGNPAYEDTTAGADPTTGPVDLTTSSGGPIYPCPDEQPFTLWYPDDDGDGYGDKRAPAVEACEAPTGHVLDHEDCNDRVPEIHPKVSELCNGVDDDCDKQVDESSQDCAACTIDLSDPNFVYWVCPDKTAITWAAAAQRCAARDGQFGVRLASVHTQAEADHLLELVEKFITPINGEQHAWFSLIRDPNLPPSCDPPSPDSGWVWADKSKFDLPPQWLPGEPNNASGICECDVETGCVEQCGELLIDLASDLRGWNDTLCDSPAAGGYICKTKRDQLLFPN